MNMHPQGGVASRDPRPNAGIDVSKQHLDACWLGEDQRLPNDATGWDALTAKFKDADVDLVVLEATGGYERALRNEYDPLPPLVLAPQFVTSHPDWLWLNRLQCLAVGRVTMADLLVRFDLYAIRVGQPLQSSGLPRAPDGAS